MIMDAIKTRKIPILKSNSVAIDSRNVMWNLLLKRGTMNLKFHLLICLFLFLSSTFIFACSQAVVQSQKETSESPLIPDCKKNYIKEGNWILGRVYKTWVKYDNLDFGKGFDAIVMNIQGRGNRIISTDRESGTINAEMAFGTQEKITYPVDIKIVEDKTSLIIHLSSEFPKGGDSSPEKFCSFYDELETFIKRVPPAPKPKQTTIPPQEPPEANKDSITPAPTPLTTQKPSLELDEIVKEELDKMKGEIEALKKDVSFLKTKADIPLSPQPKIPPSQAKVIWTNVNLREGPGPDHKVIGNVKRGTSLAILEEKEEWLHVQLEDGMIAWIIKKAISKSLEAPLPTSLPSSKAVIPSNIPSKPKNPM
jgi:hypothetical protein